MRDNGVMTRWPWFVGFVVILCAAMNSAAQEAGTLFPKPFVIEHAVIQTDADGSVFETEPVTDTYVGSRIISQRSDGSRMIIDFARREITDIRTADGRYAVIGFERMADLLRELRVLEKGASPEAEKFADVDGPPRFRVVEADRATATKSSVTPGSPAERAGVRHLRVLYQKNEKGTETPVLDVWFDPQLRVGTRGMNALEEFELEVLSAAAANAISPQALAAARREAAGAVPVLTVRSLRPGTNISGTIEDVARRVEAVEAVPVELFTVPDGFERVPHPLELMVAHERREAELNLLMGGGGS